MRASTVSVVALGLGSIAPTAKTLCAQRVAVVEARSSFASPRVRESSGVAVSRRNPGVLWTHNDSGDGPTLYATDLSGRDRGMVHVLGAEAVDWEDIAVGPCPERDAWCVFIADTGDNEERRPGAALYVLPEPDLAGGTARGAEARRIVVEFAGGPRDVEALAVDGGGTAWFISKGRLSGVAAFVAPRGTLVRDRVRVSEVPIPLRSAPALGKLVTAAAFSPRGRLGVRTYTEVYFFRVAGTQLQPDGEPCWLGFADVQGEGVDFLEEEVLVLTSEAAFQVAGTITRVRCE